MDNRLPSVVKTLPDGLEHQPLTVLSDIDTESGVNEDLMQYCPREVVQDLHFSLRQN